MSERAAIDLERLRTLLDAYGGDPLAWPDDEREASLALLARSADARRLHEAALALDAALDALPAPAPSAALEERIVAAALSTADAPPRAASVRAIHTARTARRRLPLLVSALPVAAAAALALWLWGGRSPSPEPVPAPAMEITLAGLGVYETPADELLDVPAVDGVYEAGAWVGCPDAGLGCIELDALPLEPVSRGQEERSFS